MVPRLLITSACVAVLVLFCPACAIAPDRWSITAKRQRTVGGHRADQDELDVMITGPLPTFHHE